MNTTFHDWTFVGLSVEWHLGNLTLELRDQASQLRLLNGRNLASVTLPRQHPWGPSVSINKVEHRQDGPNILLRVEMQSGDVIECVAGSFDLQ